jgi:hypothetical protein
VRLFLSTALVFALSVSSAGAPAASSDEDGKLTFCHFGPKMKVIETAAPQSESGDSCSGTAKIQGVMWECGGVEQLSSKTERFRKELQKLAEEECSKHCSNRVRGCQGKVVRPFRYGLQTDSEDAIAAGKRVECGAGCPGQAFIYTSIYDAGFRTEDPSRTGKQAANCLCSLP